MAGFRGPSSGAPKRGYAGVAGADLANAPTGPVPFTSPFGIPVTRMQTWHAGGNQPGVGSGGVPGTPIQRASGNPNVATAQTVQSKAPYGGSGWNDRFMKGNPPGQLPYGDNQNPTSIETEIPQFGGPQRVLTQSQETAVRAPGNAPVGYSNDKLVAYDRHGMFKSGYENSGRNSGQTDPPLDGPARPSLWLVQRTINYQSGSDKSAATDDLTRDYTRNSTGMYVGEQGTGWSHIYGGTPGLYQEYGSYQGIAPATPGYDPITGATQGINSPVPQGAPGDGPHDVWSGPPHGLHSPTLPAYAQTIGRYMAIPQMANPRIDRPSNSPIAGQSYSQTVIPQGQTGTNVAQPVKWGTANYNQRAKGNGWRGNASV
jgi:hypothetical protein